MVILSIDGGGIRTYIPLIFLFELEIRTRRNISTMFDLMGGTGFGAILASALNISSQVNTRTPKYTASELISFFHSEAKNIFADLLELATVYKSLRSISTAKAKLGGSKYDGHGLQKSLQDLFMTR